MQPDDLRQMTFRTRDILSSNKKNVGHFERSSEIQENVRQNRPCRCSDLKDLPRPRILLLGRTGKKILVQLNLRQRSPPNSDHLYITTTILRSHI